MITMWSLMGISFVISRGGYIFSHTLEGGGGEKGYGKTKGQADTYIDKRDW